MRWIGFLFIGFILTACEVAPPAQTRPETTVNPVSAAKARIISEKAARQFVEVVQRVEPIAERECRAITSGQNCDFQIVVDDRPNQAPNAFQTQDRRGRPIIAFNLPLILAAQNSDELAFVMGHEAAHHIAGHLDRTRQNATVGAVVLSGLAALSGASAESVKAAERLGASVGARTYSKDFELEADILGTIIADKSGYDPLIGVKFFSRIPDPGNKFLGTHPPNRSRIEAVQRTVAQL